MEKTKSAIEFDKQLEAYRKQNAYNILVPSATIQEISPYHKPVLEIVKINPDPNAGEVYQIVQGSSDFSLRATALQKIGYAAGLIWNARGCQRTDDGMNPNIVSYRAEAAVRKEDGTYMPLNAEYMVDLEVIEQETRDSYEKKSVPLAKEKKWAEKDRKDYVEKNVRRDMLQKRKFRLQLAQTGAMDRVIRKILGLKGTYKREELEKPFIVPKIAFSPDASDPKVREALLRQGLEATNVLFGPSETSLIEHMSKKDEPIDIIPVPEETAPPLDLAEQPGKEKSFEQMTEIEQIKHLEDLKKKKGYPESKQRKPLDDFTAAERQKFYDHLQAMPDASEELPFG